MPPARQGVEEHGGQVRIAYRLGTKYAGKLLHVNEIGWLYWDGKRYTIDNCGYAKRAVLNVLGDALKESLTDQNLRKDVAKCETATGITGVLAIASALEEFAVTYDDLDADPWLLNLANGTLDLRTMERQEHDPRDRITKVTRGAYWPGEDTIGPSWSTFLNRVLPDGQVRGYLRRAVGLALLGKVSEHILPILKGKGANGKGTFYQAVMHSLGDYAAAADPELFMDREGAHPTGQMDLIGRRMVVVSETAEDRGMNQANMKRLVGGDKIKARHMRRVSRTCSLFPPWKCRQCG
jgi:putative DNA primase/helicase